MCKLHDFLECSDVACDMGLPVHTTCLPFPFEALHSCLSMQMLFHQKLNPAGI